MRSLACTKPTPRPTDRPIPRGARVVALFAACIGATGVLGWLAAIESLRAVHPAMPAMQPNTALSIVACGISLGLPDRARVPAILLALFSVVVGALTTVEYVSGRDLGIDHAVLRGTMRMSPQTAVAATLTGLAMLTRRLPGHQGLAQPLVVVPVTLCYLSMVGLLLRATVPVFPLATTMAVPTGTAFALLGAAVALSQPERGLVARWRSRGPGGRTVRTLLPAFVVLPTALGILRMAGERRGIYDEGFGIALQATVMMVLLAAGTLRHGQSLDEREEARARQADRFRKIVENIPEGVSVMNADGRVLYANPRLCDLLGRSAGPGLALVDCVDPAVRDLFHDFLRRAEQGPARVTVAVNAGAERRFLRLAAAPVPDPLPGMERTTLLVVVDDTSRRIAEDHLRTRAGELQIALRDLDAFATVASHELREPLRKIQLLADVARDAPAGDPSAADALGRIRRAAALLQDRVAALHTYSRLGASARVVPNVDVAAVVREAEGRLSARITEAGASVVVGVLPTIEADPALLCELFTHLFDNALKFRRPGVPPVIEVASAPRSGGRVAITVADNGVGLDESDSGHLFEVFRTAHARGRFDGQGIGLATCRRIAELHGGEITARGSPGQGSVFTVCLPVRAHPGVPAECVPVDVP